MKQDTTIRIFSLFIALIVAVPAVQAALTVDAGGDRTALAGEPVTILATCNDTDVFDAMNLSASVDWSTGTTGAEVVQDDEQNGTVRATYTYPAAGAYAVTVKVVNNATGAVACDTLNVTVAPQTAEVKVAPKTLNQKSNGVMTVFISIAEWFRFAGSGSENTTVSDPSEFRIGNATPERVNFCMKDGGTLILKYRQQDLDLATGDGNLTVTGSAVTENGNVSVAGTGAVSVINPGNGKKMEKGDADGYAWTAKGNAKEKVKNQKGFLDAQQKSNGRAKGQTP